MILKVLSNINNSIKFYDVQEEGEKVFGFKKVRKYFGEESNEMKAKVLDF